MSRSNYSDDWDVNWQTIMWRGAVASAINGKRGQAFLKEMRAALDALPEKRLIAENLVHADGAVCAMGAVGKARGIDMSKLNAEDSATVARTFRIAGALVREIAYINDEGTAFWDYETPEQRYTRVRLWVEQHITP